MIPIRFVTPRYGADIMGGAEWGARQLATKLAADGWSVEVFTTCARDFRTWADEHPAGSTVEDGVTVHRFGVRRPRAAGFDRATDEILARLPDVGIDDALEWIDIQGPDSPALLDAVAGVDDGVLALYPYLYQPTVRGAALARVPTVLHAAAHPEPPLDLPVFDELFSSVSALAHHSRAEQDLVARRFPETRTTPQVVLGLPIDDVDADPVAARAALGLGDEPFVVWLGRIDRGKGVHELVERFADVRRSRGGGNLVLAGPVVDPPPPTPGVRVLGPVPEEHKAGLLAAADVFVNPSPHESFSIVILEAWLAGTPVLVNGWCEPMRHHCEESGGGLWYMGRADFEIALTRLLDDPGARDRLADAGRDYVRSRYGWPIVKRRYEGLLSGMLAGSGLER